MWSIAIYSELIYFRLAQSCQDHCLSFIKKFSNVFFHTFVLCRFTVASNSHSWMERPDIKQKKLFRWLYLEVNGLWSVGNAEYWYSYRRLGIGCQWANWNSSSVVGAQYDSCLLVFQSICLWVLTLHHRIAVPEVGWWKPLTNACEIIFCLNHVCLSKYFVGAFQLVKLAACSKCMIL